MSTVILNEEFAESLLSQTDDFAEFADILKEACEQREDKNPEIQRVIKAIALLSLAQQYISGEGPTLKEDTKAWFQKINYPFDSGEVIPALDAERYTKSAFLRDARKALHNSLLLAWKGKCVTAPYPEITGEAFELVETIDEIIDMNQAPRNEGHPFVFRLS